MSTPRNNNEKKEVANCRQQAALFRWACSCGNEWRQTASSGVRRCPDTAPSCRPPSATRLGSRLTTRTKALHTPDRTLPRTPRRTIGTNGPAHAQVARMATAPVGDAPPNEDAMVRRRHPLPSRRGRVPYTFPDHTPHMCQSCASIGCTPSHTPPESGRRSCHRSFRQQGQRHPHKRNWALSGRSTISTRLPISSTR